MHIWVNMNNSPHVLCMYPQSDSKEKEKKEKEKEKEKDNHVTTNQS